jgi:hypothetical protein
MRTGCCHIETTVSSSLCMSKDNAAPVEGQVVYVCTAFSFRRQLSALEVVPIAQTSVGNCNLRVTKGRARRFVQSGTRSL